jgi:hypothetical protein
LTLVEQIVDGRHLEVVQHALQRVERARAVVLEV